MYGHKPRSFPPNCAQKMPESQQMFLRLRIMSRIFEEFQHLAIQAKIVQPFRRVFQCVSQQGERKGFYSILTVIRTSRRLDSFLYEVAQNFEVFSNIFKTEITNQKLIAVDVLFKAYRMVPLSCRSHLTRWHL